jgi:hypothetical protein
MYFLISLPKGSKKGEILFQESGKIIMDRDSYEYAQKVFEKCLPDVAIRLKVMKFLAEAIAFAHKKNAKNWNVNMDNNSIDFNVGPVRSIAIYAREEKGLRIFCDREILKPKVIHQTLPFEYVSYLSWKPFERVFSKDINELSDAFKNVKNSIGCKLHKSDVLKNLDILKESHFAFIALASQKKLRTNSEKAHAKGAILYLSKELDRVIPNPTYSQQTIYDFLNEEKEILEKELKKARTKSKEERAEKLRDANPKPDKKSVEVIVFKRNPYVILEVLERANGICERCKKTAPFLTDTPDNRPYLEVHHKIPLAENGDDTVANAIALCPNCHRHAHYGKKSYDKI